MISIRERKIVLLDGWNEGMDVWSDVIDLNFPPAVCLLVLGKKEEVKIERKYVNLWHVLFNRCMYCLGFGL